MPEWKISVPEVHRRTVVVDADTFEDAIRTVLNGEADYLDTGDVDYSSTMDPTDAEWILLDQV